MYSKMHCGLTGTSVLYMTAQGSQTLSKLLAHPRPPAPPALRAVPRSQLTEGAVLALMGVVEKQKKSAFSVKGTGLTYS